MRWIVVMSLLFAAHINLTALVPAAAGQAPPPWWVGGRLLWPFGLDTHTLLPAGGVLGTLTPLLGIASATLFLLAAGAVLHWVVPAQWLAALVLSGAAASVARGGATPGRAGTGCTGRPMARCAGSGWCGRCAHAACRTSWNAGRGRCLPAWSSASMQS